MKYGLDSFLPEGAFEHCGDRRIRLYGGGGGVSSVVSAVGKAVSDVGNAVATVGKQVGDVVTNSAKAIGDAGTNLAHGQIGGAFGSIVNGVIGDVSILTGGKPMQKPNGQPTQGQGQASGTQTVAADNSQQKSTSLNDPAILGAPQGSGSLTTRTVSGPDNTYKLNKSTMLGL